MTSLLQKSVELLLRSCPGYIMWFSSVCATWQYLIKTNTSAKRKSSYRATESARKLTRKVSESLVTHGKPLLHPPLHWYFTLPDDVTGFMLLKPPAFGKYIYFFLI